MFEKIGNKISGYADHLIQQYNKQSAHAKGLTHAQYERYFNHKVVPNSFLNYLNQPGNQNVKKNVIPKWGGKFLETQPLPLSLSKQDKTQFFEKIKEYVQNLGLSSKNQQNFLQKIDKSLILLKQPGKDHSYDSNKLFDEFKLALQTQNIPEQQKQNAIDAIRAFRINTNDNIQRQFKDFSNAYKAKNNKPYITPDGVSPVQAKSMFDQTKSDVIKNVTDFYNTNIDGTVVDKALQTVAQPFINTYNALGQLGNTLTDLNQVAMAPVKFANGDIGGGLWDTLAGGVKTIYNIPASGAQLLSVATAFAPIGLALGGTALLHKAWKNSKSYKQYNDKKDKGAWQLTKTLVKNTADGVVDQTDNLRAKIGTQIYRNTDVLKNNFYQGLQNAGTGLANTTDRFLKGIGGGIANTTGLVSGKVNQYIQKTGQQAQKLANSGFDRFQNWAGNQWSKVRTKNLQNRLNSVRNIDMKIEGNKIKQDQQQFVDIPMQQDIIVRRKPKLDIIRPNGIFINVQNSDNPNQKDLRSLQIKG